MNFTDLVNKFLDNANDVIQSVASDGRFLYVNSSWKRILGYSDEQLERLKLTDIVHPAQRVKIQRELERILDGGQPARFDVDYVAADGRVVMLSGSMQPQQVGGKTVSAQSIFRDVTEQRLAQRELDASRRNLTALVENTGDSIWSVDREHRLITLNSAFALAVEAAGHVPAASGSRRLPVGSTEPPTITGHIAGLKGGVFGGTTAHRQDLARTRQSWGNERNPQSSSTPAASISTGGTSSPPDPLTRSLVGAPTPHAVRAGSRRSLAVQVPWKRAVG